MTRKKQEGVLGLAPVPAQRESGSLIYYDPFKPVEHKLTPPERLIVTAWRRQALVIRAQMFKAAVAARTIGELHEETTDEFTQTALALDSYNVIAQGTESEAYVGEFVHRQKQLLAGELEDAVKVTVDSIKEELAQNVTALQAILAQPEKRRNFFQRLGYLITGR